MKDAIAIDTIMKTDPTGVIMSVAIIVRITATGIIAGWELVFGFISAVVAEDRKARKTEKQTNR